MRQDKQFRHAAKPLALGTCDLGGCAVKAVVRPGLYQSLMGRELATKTSRERKSSVKTGNKPASQPVTASDSRHCGASVRSRSTRWAHALVHATFSLIMADVLLSKHNTLLCASKVSSSVRRAHTARTDALTTLGSGLPSYSAEWARAAAKRPNIVIACCNARKLFDFFPPGGRVVLGKVAALVPSSVSQCLAEILAVQVAPVGVARWSSWESPSIVLSSTAHWRRVVVIFDMQPGGLLASFLMERGVVEC